MKNTILLLQLLSGSRRGCHFWSTEICLNTHVNFCCPSKWIPIIFYSRIRESLFLPRADQHLPANSGGYWLVENVLGLRRCIMGRGWMEPERCILQMVLPRAPPPWSTYRTFWINWPVAGPVGLFCLSFFRFQPLFQKPIYIFSYLTPIYRVSQK